MNEFTPELEAFIRTMADPACEPEARHAAFDALWDYGDVIVPAMIALLEHGDAPSRNYAATQLGRLNDPKAVEPLLRALNDDDAQVQAIIVETLGTSGDIRAVEPLIVLLRDEHVLVRCAAAEALGELNDARAVAPLLEALHHPHHYGRGAAASALASIGDEHVLVSLIDALRTSYDKHEAHEIAIAISSFHEHAFPLLVDALHDDDSNLRYWAAIAAGQLDHQALLVRLHWREANDHAETHTRAKVSTAARKAIRNIRRRQQFKDNNTGDNLG